MSRRILCCAFLSLVALLPGLSGKQGDQDTGVIVAGITGHWKEMDCEKPAKPEGRILQFASAFHTGSCTACDGGSLVLLKEEAQKALSFPCQNDEDLRIQCAGMNGWNCRHIKLESNDPGFGTRLLAAMLPQPFIHYVVPVSRGLEPELAEAVVPLSADRIDLGAAFRDMNPGTYRIRLEPLTETGSATSPVQVQWAEGGAAIASLPGFQPGLYKLEWLTSSGQLGGPDAWVLVSGPRDFQKARAAFQEAVDATQKWPDGVDARAPRAFLRGVLDKLSRQVPMQQ